MQMQFEDTFEQIMKPTLVRHGFERVMLDSCMRPEELWRRGRLWFSTSLDLRDQYLDVCLGHLYWFHDVMPRVIILGEFSSYANFDPFKKYRADGLVDTLSSVRDAFDHALEVYRTRYEDILQARLHPKKSKYVKEYVTALGQEVQDSELEKYIA
jgi:hypothetical protein